MMQILFLTILRNSFIIIVPLLNQAYWWWHGLNFNNNLSQELQSLYTLFFIWLSNIPFNQVKTAKIVGKSLLNSEKRLEFLDKTGHLLITIIYIKWYIIFYFSRYLTILTKKLMAVIYQNICRLSRLDRKSRSVIDKSVLFPLLDQYPERSSINSLANKKYFQVLLLNEWPFLFEILLLELKSLVHREYMLSDSQNY